MINFRSPITIIIILVLAIIAGAMIGNSQWFGKLLTSIPKIKEGDACTDSNGNPSTIVNGVCKEVVKDNPSGDQSLRVSAGPDSMSIRRRPFTRPQATVVLAQYPATTYQYTGMDNYYYYYKKA